MADLDRLDFRTWHEAPGWARDQLVGWVRGMVPDRDNENGCGPEGTGAWLEEKVAASRNSGLFQTFLGLFENEVMWTGSVVADDRGMRSVVEKMGCPVDGFFGLFNTHHDRRGRGLGWAGANAVDRHIAAFVGGAPLRIGLFTANPAAERHYRSLAFAQQASIRSPSSSKMVSFYLKAFGSN